MVLTQDNVGDVIFMYQTGERIKIDAVKQDGFIYHNEKGVRNTGNGLSLNGFVDGELSARERFDRNVDVARCLQAAKASAVHKLFLEGSPDEMDDAQRVLHFAETQLDHLHAHITADNELAGKNFAEKFLSELYERGTGSHDLFMGTRVEVASSWTGEFRINGEIHDMSAATDVLSRPSEKQAEKGTVKKSGSSLDELISRADSQNRSAAHPGREQQTVNHER